MRQRLRVLDIGLTLLVVMFSVSGGCILSGAIEQSRSESLTVKDGRTPAPTTTAPGASVAASQSTCQNPFGVMLPPEVVRSPEGMQVAKSLGAVYFRPTAAIFLNRWDGTCTECDIATSAGLKLVLTVRNTGPQATTPPKDLAAYKRKLGEVLDKYRPALLVVENEENWDLFYTGTPEEYAAELKAACEVAHQKGIPCTNGGLMGTLVAMLVYDHYIETGQLDEAQDFAARVFTPELQQQLNSPKAKEQIRKGKALLSAYRAAGVDYVNFHWYFADTKALEEAVAYLRAQTGLSVITNEVGQRNDDPQQTTAVMGKIVELDLPIAVWFGRDAQTARGLVNLDGSLRPTGEAFKRFIEQNFKSCEKGSSQDITAPEVLWTKTLPPATQTQVTALQPEWVKVWGPGHEFPGAGETGANQAWDVIISGGHLYVTGNDQVRTPGDIDLFVRKYDLAGNLVWEQTWDNGPKDAGLVIVADAVGSDLFLYIGGYTRVGNTNRALLQKRDAADGRVIWTKTWENFKNGHHEVDGIAVVGDALYVSHYDAKWLLFNINAVLLKFDKNELDSTNGKADPEWTTVWGNLNAEQDSTDGHIYADETGVWVTGRIGGRTFLPRGGGDLYLTKIDPSGKQLWTKTWGGKQYDQGLSLTSDGESLFVTGWTASHGRNDFDAVVLRFGKDGTAASERVWGGAGWQFARGVAVDGEHVFAAAATQESSSDPRQTAVLKLNKRTLELVTAALWEGGGADSVTASIYADGSSLYLVGRTSRFTDGKSRYQPVLMKVPKGLGEGR